MMILIDVTSANSLYLKAYFLWFQFQTKKDKFFVLRSTSSSGPARLEYHDSEKKFKAGQLPKRQIHLHKCFNINKKSDTRQKNCIALYLVDECFAVIVKDAAEMQVWLDLMLEHQYEYLTDEQLPYPHYGKFLLSLFYFSIVIILGF